MCAKKTALLEGIVHSTAGYMIGTYATFKYVFDYKPGEVYWCTADIGWITGHSYIVYGPLLAGSVVCSRTYDLIETDTCRQCVC